MLILPGGISEALRVHITCARADRSKTGPDTHRACAPHEAMSSKRADLKSSHHKKTNHVVTDVTYCDPLTRQIPDHYTAALKLCQSHLRENKRKKTSSLDLLK